MASLAVLPSGCATMKESLATGFATGATIGAIGGAAIHRQERPKAMAIGVISGGIIGLLISKFTHDNLERRDARVRRKTLFDLDKHRVSRPLRFPKKSHSLTEPTVEHEYVEEHISKDGKRLVEGHNTWTIRDESRWIPQRNGQ